MIACSDFDASKSAPREITLCASIQNDFPATKAPYELSVPSAENPLTAAIWASSTSKKYWGKQKDEPGADATYIDYHNSTCFTSGSRQILDHQLFYPENKEDVYFVGLCPRSADGWALDSLKVEEDQQHLARFSFDGKTDVMYAPEVHNSIKFSSIDLQLSFKHVLTWIRFKVVADDEAVNAWGPLNKITINSNEQVFINLVTDTCTFSAENKSFPTYCTTNGVYSDEVFTNKNIVLSTTPQEVAYTMCAATQASSTDGLDEYSITVHTVNRPNTDVGINLKDALGESFSGNTGGKQFTVTLHFKLGENIVTTVSATPWANAGIGVAAIEE